MRTFAITYDYLCPFARNCNEHVLAGLDAGAAWDVTFVPFSLAQAKAAEAGDVRWDPPAALRRSGVLALAVAEIVRAEHPERFHAVHRALFALRHDKAKDLRDPGVVAESLAEAGAPSALVDRAEDGLAALRASHESLVAREVWGVPTLLGAQRGVFVRVLDRAGDDASVSVARIERIIDLVNDEPMLHEFKQVDLPV